MRAAFALVAVSVLGCAARPLLPDREPARVTEVTLQFTSREAGELSFELQLPPGTGSPRFVTWELLLGGARLAAGMDGAVVANNDRCRVTTPLSAKHLVWREGEGNVDVLLRGQVDFGNPDARLTFRELREMQMQGQPQLSSPID